MLLTEFVFNSRPTLSVSFFESKFTYSSSGGMRVYDNSTHNCLMYPS